MRVCVCVYVHVCCLLYPSADCRCLGIQAAIALDYSYAIGWCNMMCVPLWCFGVFYVNKEYQDQKATVNPVFYKAKLDAQYKPQSEVNVPSSSKGLTNTILYAQTVHTAAVFLSVMQALGSIESYCSCDLYLKRNTKM